jgi:5-methylthioadenosine/S-adenosylhomocysteine deaminase
MPKIAIINALYLAINEAELQIQRGNLFIENDKITHLDTTTTDSAHLNDYQIIDGSHRLYLPGLINTHGHSAMTLLRGVSDDVALQDWFNSIWPLEAKFTPDMVAKGSLLAIAEMIKGGTTCFVDMYDNMDKIATGVAMSGMRACLTRGVIGLCRKPEWLAKIKEAKNFAKDWHGQCDNRITTMISPHAPYTCPPEVIEQLVEVAHELDLPMHTHLAETLQEVMDCEQQYGMRPIDYLEKHHFFSRPSLLAHVVHVNSAEIDKLVHYKAHISHNPGSNLKLGSGIAPITQFIAKNMVVALGTDSAASNNNLDIFEEMRLAALIHKGSLQDPKAVSAAQALRMATVNGANALWRNDIGILAPGMKADIIAIDIDQPHFYPQSNLVSQLVYSAAAKDVTDVWVDGKPLMRNRALLTLDEEKVKREFASCYSKLRA